MMHEDNQWKLLVGIFLATIVVVWAWSTARSGLCELATELSVLDQKRVISCLEFWLNRYQTLLTGIFALAGAFATVWAVLVQVRHANQAEERQLAREREAWRGVLALALSGVVDYANQCSKAVLELEQLTSSRGLKPAPSHFPELPEALIQTLRECIRISHSEEAKKIAELLSRLQIQNARLKQFHSESWVSDHAIDQALWDAAELYALASPLFDYARRSEEGSLRRVPVNEITKALRLFRIHEGERPSLDRLIEIRAKAEAKQNAEDLEEKRVVRQ